MVRNKMLSAQGISLWIGFHSTGLRQRFGVIWMKTVMGLTAHWVHYIMGMGFVNWGVGKTKYYFCKKFLPTPRFSCRLPVIYEYKEKQKHEME